MPGQPVVKAKGKRPASATMPMNGAKNGFSHGAGGGRHTSVSKTANISAEPRRLSTKPAKLQPVKNGKTIHAQTTRIAKSTGIAKNTGPAKKTHPPSKAVSGREAHGPMQHNGSNDKDAHSMNGTAVATRPKASASTAAARNGDSSADAKRSEIVLPPSYKPSDSEPFMNARHRHYFRLKLQKWKEDIVRQNMETLKGLHDDSPQQADPADRATVETDRALELRARDRQRKLMGKIDSALARIEEGSYGYCEETGEPISLKRLDARPIATLSLEAQERRERREKIFRED